MATTSTDSLEQLRFPIGRWSAPAAYIPAQIQTQMTVIERFPRKLEATIAPLSDKQLDITYRPDGWTVRQVVHHCADSHMNAFIRFKLALTEDRPTIKPYLEALWAELPDGRTMPVAHSILLIDGLHTRWSALLKSLSEAQWHRGFIHPEHGRELKLYEVVSLYAWHCEHHLGHILSTLR